MVTTVALLQASSQTEAEMQTRQRKQVQSIAALSMGLLLCSVLSGVCTFEDKWIPIIELRWSSSEEWQAVREQWPRGDFGYILSEHNDLPQDVGNATIVNCGLTPEENPCYPFMKPLAIHIWVMTMLCPLLPNIAALIHKWWKAGTIQNMHDGCLHRTAMYAGAVVFLQVWIEAKRLLQARMHWTFDASDTIYALLWAAVIGAREVSHLHWHAIPSWMLAGALMLAGTLGQMYYVFFTARFFHSPLEVLAGAAIGGLFCAIFVRMSTTKRALKTVFFSADEERYVILEA